MDAYDDDDEEAKELARNPLARVIARNRLLFPFGVKLASMRSMVPFYLVAAIVLLIVARPLLAAILVTGLVGLVCGGLQLLAAAFGRMFWFRAAEVIVYGGLTVAVYFGVYPFHPSHTSLLQVASVVALAIALQHVVCGYLQAWALGGLSFAETTEKAK